MAKVKSKRKKIKASTAFSAGHQLSNEGLSFLLKMYFLLTLSVLSVVLTSYFMYWYTLHGDLTLLESPYVKGVFTYAWVGMLLFGFVVMLLGDSLTSVLMYLLFVLSISISIGSVVLPFLLTGFVSPVINAAALTFGIFFCITWLVIIKGRSFETSESFLQTALFILLILGIVNAFFVESTTLEIVTAGFGSLVFAGYILHSTQEVVRGNEESCLRASVMMFLNIVNLFLYLLRIFAYIAKPLSFFVDDDSST